MPKILIAILDFIVLIAILDFIVLSLIFLVVVDSSDKR